MKKLTLNCIFTSICIVLFCSLQAQEPVKYESPSHEFDMAMELFQKEKYGAAQQYFKYVYENSKPKQQDIQAASYFYMGVCAAHLNNNDAVFLLKEFLRRFPVHAYVPEAHYYLGKFYFYKKQYKRALENYNAIQEKHVPKDELAEYYFKKGYCYFDSEKLDEAQVFLDKAKNSNGVYQNRAIYYLSHIAYQEQHYQKALEGFEKIKDISEYQDIAEVYIAQIHFYQKDYAKAAKSLENVLSKVPQKEKTDIEKLLALSYYYLANYKNAAPHFLAFANTTKNPIDRNDYFAMGYSYYQLKQYEQAIEYLSNTIKEKDAIAQNAYYIIGDCYIQIRQLSLASQSFLEASKMDYSSDMKEDAMYNYAKLQYETSTSPFSTAIKALENYIETYPNSLRSEEATSYLSAIFMSTKNYQAAIQSLEKMKSKSPALLKAYQRCTYYRGLELINANRYEEAVGMFKKSVTYPIDKTLRLSAQYWKAEAEYRNQQYKDAYYDLRSYQQAEQAKNDENYEMSHYTLGYSAFKLHQYSEAILAFKTALASKIFKQDVQLEADARARLADCYFLQKDLNTAITEYKNCEKLGQNNADYALYQIAKSYEYLRNDKAKLETLEKLKLYYSNSIYRDDTEFEIASTYHTMNDYNMAILSYENFIKNCPKSKYIQIAYTKMAQAYVNTQNTEKAIEIFKYVFEKYPGTQAARDAMTNLENIYTEQGNTSEFFAYIQKRNVNLSANKQDSIAFKSGENKYLRGDCEMAIKGLNDYLKQFPKGMFAPKAYFYKAECEYGTKDFEQALSDYQQLIQMNQIEYIATALQKAATILYNMKQYSQSLEYFYQLQSVSSDPEILLYAQTGVMHTSFILKKYAEALKAARYVAETKLNNPDLVNEARLIAGKTAFELKNYEIAEDYFEMLALNTSNRYAAEADYYLCRMVFEQKDLSKCEDLIKKMLDTQYGAASDYWFASVIILYGDYYAANNNFAQARLTYQSIIDNYDGADLVEVATQKIQYLDELEKAKEPKEIDDHIYEGE